MEAMRRGGNIPTVFNAANEKAVAMFLERRIAFLDIPDIIASAMEEIAYIKTSVGRRDSGNGGSGI